MFSDQEKVRARARVSVRARVGASRSARGHGSGVRRHDDCEGESECKIVMVSARMMVR